MSSKTWIIPKVPICKSHKPIEISYLGWFDMVEKRYKAGIKQSQCKICMRWFFKDEM